MSHVTCKAAHQELPTPSIPQASRHGIGVRLASQLTVHVEPYTNMDEGDLIELFWDGCYVASKILKASDIDKTIVLRVPESFLQNGKARTYYRVMKIGGTPLTSPCRKLWVKLNAPGGNLISAHTEENQDLAPLYVAPSVIRRGLSRRHLEGGLPMTIEPYLNMAVHDEITVRWGDLRMDLPPLTTEDVGEPIDLVIPPALIIEGGEEQRLEVTYCVIDRVGNNSLWAPLRLIKALPIEE